MGFTIRAVIASITSRSTLKKAIEAHGLQKWLGGRRGRVEVVHHLALVSRVELLLQQPPSRGVSIVELPAVLEVKNAGKKLCRYHEGPPGRPEEHYYCTRVAETASGFCREHSRSPLALFEKCAAGNIEACSLVDEAWRGEEYVVYALDYGGDKLKIGLTRKWRFFWRIAEQPHVSAAVLYTTKSLVEARRVEKQLGKAIGATEGSGVRMHSRILSSTSMLKSLSQERIAERIATLLHRLGLEGVYEAYTILPREGLPLFSRLPKIGVKELIGIGEVLLLDYWAGLLRASTRRRELVLDKKSLQHIVLQGSIRKTLRGSSAEPI